MIVVSDTSPLHYLILIDCAHLLPELYGRVITTLEVVEELSRVKTPQKVREWVAEPPAWLEIQEPTIPLIELPKLGLGEASAITLAKELAAELLLIDERYGTQIAQSSGLLVTGTLGVLKGAARRGLISLPVALEALRHTTYRYTPKLFEQLLKDDDASE